ncbi:uncharacterized protein K444DRAFT_658386 [Hyaloscypha bicolor E]|uniref:VanZ-like domain-containing protein n=1 Tax=Hyaloscypha bicolor E TaxID=1095630 RepID=A0A2J6TWC9_9HELO|nr:uncharacterized protein K444DRAFT_658386 [Hyaloscypha bicolor E]PMD67305.1 hypothetical protein K444DRAFT_658386 [Hyaloscypha bicolor E]
MRIRLPFAGAFLFFVATAGYVGLTSLQVDTIVDDKILHFLTFFILTTCFYWILDTSRRRSLNFTLLICTGVLGIGSEFLQDILQNGRKFDFYDIVANITGSLAAIGLSTWYHMRMLERKRLAKQYQVVPGEEDLELGEGVGAQELGTVTAAAAAPTLDEEVENWDENLEDGWEEDEHTADSAEGEGLKTPSASSAGEIEGEHKRRSD